MEGYKLTSEFKTSFNRLKSYCENEGFKGWDPYDGLNSKIFRATPLKKWDLARLAWIQGFKRSPINLRRLLLVPKQYNSKGIALFLEGYCNLYHYCKKTKDTDFGRLEEIQSKIEELGDLLLSMQNSDYHGACWGYNFDWQARRLFLFPDNTPTIVATSFCVHALFEAFEITKKQEYYSTAISAAEFVIQDLHRTDLKDGFLFSYSPLNGNNTVFNASLLGAKILSEIFSYTKDQRLIDLAQKTVKACCDMQQKDGSWVYGLLPVQNWIDSFHTGYNLVAIQAYQNCSGDNSFSSNLELGFKYYIENFFLEDGTPKYYHDRTYPIDIHCPGQLFVTLNQLEKKKENEALATKVLTWTFKNMQDKKGYFYYQLKKSWSSKIPYMRWSQAFMFSALSHNLNEKSK
jgi:hypothetical protein